MEAIKRYNSLQKYYEVGGLRSKEVLETVVKILREREGVSIKGELGVGEYIKEEELDNIYKEVKDIVYKEGVVEKVSISMEEYKEYGGESLKVLLSEIQGRDEGKVSGVAKGVLERGRGTYKQIVYLLGVQILREKRLKRVYKVEDMKREGIEGKLEELKELGVTEDVLEVLKYVINESEVVSVELMDRVWSDYKDKKEKEKGYKVNLNTEEGEEYRRVLGHILRHSVGVVNRRAKEYIEKGYVTSEDIGVIRKDLEGYISIEEEDKEHRESNKRYNVEEDEGVKSILELCASVEREGVNLKEILTEKEYSIVNQGRTGGVLSIKQVRHLYYIGSKIDIHYNLRGYSISKILSDLKAETKGVSREYIEKVEKEGIKTEKEMQLIKRMYINLLRR